MEQIQTRNQFQTDEKRRELTNAIFDFCIRVLNGNGTEGERQILLQLIGILPYV
jgi:predicted secreted protein